MAEEWEKYYTKEQLSKLQKIELENLKVFIDVCEKLNLKKLKKRDDKVIPFSFNMILWKINNYCNKVLL